MSILNEFIIKTYEYVFTGVNMNKYMNIYKYMCIYIYKHMQLYTHIKGL